MTDVMLYSHSMSDQERVLVESKCTYSQVFLKLVLTSSSLAYSEMRLIMALMVFNFDMKLADECQDWINQKNFLMWQKPQLKVHLTPVDH